MGLIEIVRNSALFLGLVSCVSEYPGYERGKFHPVDFVNSPYVSLTGYHKPENPKKTLVHIKQKHFILSASEQDYLSINQNQRQIYNFLKDMKKDGVNQLWVEGLSNFLFEDFNPARDYNVIFNHVAKKKFFFDELINGSIDQLKFIPGASLLLGRDCEYNLIPAEDFYLYERALLSLETNSGIYQNVLKSREDFLVGKIAKSEKDYAFFVYGAGHNFVDNVIDWNSKNSNAQMEIIELTPKNN